MASGSGITLKRTPAVDITTPPTDKVTAFVDDSTGDLAQKDDAGTVTSLRGATGAGVPTGGATGQSLVKASGTDYDTAWANRYAPGGTDVAVADGGTGASTASGARTNLGLALGSDVDARVMTTQDDLVVGGVSGAAARLGKGSDGQVLTVDPVTHHLIWATPSSGFSDPMTTRGDIIVRNAANATARLGRGAATYVLTSDGTDVAWGAPSGGAGSDLLQTNVGAGSVYVPGLRGSPDAKPASPNAADDEFEALSGWTTLGALDTLNVSDVPSHVHLAKTTGGQSVDGIYKASPSMPFTVTAKVSDRAFDTDYQMAGLMLLEAAPGKLIVFGGRHHVSFHGLAWERASWTNRTTNAGADVDTDVGLGTGLAGNLDNSSILHPYLRFIVTSSTSVTMQVSAKGLSWITIYSAVNPGFTIGSVGLFLYSYAAVSNEAWFDWIRFT